MTQNVQADFVLQVDTLLHVAFETGAEAALVRRLRGDGALAAEISLPGQGDGLAGYAALSWMEAPQGWLCLAPMAVNPTVQRQGLGSRLVELALNWASARAVYTVVLGDPDYYGARGFSRERARWLETPYQVDFTLLAGPGTDAPRQSLRYPVAFSDLT